MYAFEALKAELEQVDKRHFICWRADNAGRSAMPVALHLGSLYEQLLRALLPLPARSLSGLGRRKREAAPARTVFTGFAGP